ncbi:MAG: ComEC/Rec2 family competence protein [Acutalibacteraceae bacterium]
MKRPMAVIGISFLLTLVIIGKTGERFALIFLVFSLVVFAVSMFIKKLRQAVVIPSACLAVACACLLFITKTNYEYKPQLSLAGQNVSIQGVIVEDVGKSESQAYRYIIKTSKINGQDYEMKIRLSSSTLTDAQYYDKVDINNATLYELGKDSSQKLYYKSKGVYIGAYTFEEIEHIKTENKPFYYKFIRLRQYIKDAILEMLPNDEGAILAAMLIGDSRYISENAYKSFKKTGVTHLFAVSGLHASMWSMFVYQGLRNLGVRRKKSAGVSMAFILCFMCLCAFTPSIMRAGIMMFIFMGGKLLDAEPDSVNSLGVAALLVTISNPFCVTNVGLLLSFCATLGILLMSEPMGKITKEKTKPIKNKNLRILINTVIDLIIITISATIFTFPVLLLSFNAISLISPVVNLFITNIAGVAMLLSGVGVVIFAIPVVRILKYPIFFICGLLAKYMLWCTNFFAKFSLSYVSLHNNYIIPWVISVFLIIAFALIIKGDTKKNLQLSALLSLNILLFAMLFDKILNNGITTINIVEVGNGTSVVLSRKDHSAVVGCDGNYFAKWNIDKVLQQNNTDKIDLLIVPRTQKTQSNAKDEIRENYNVGMQVLKQESEDINLQILLWDDVDIYLNSGDVASFSTIKIGNFKMLITFIPTIDISKIPQEFLKSDVLICRSKVPCGLEYKNFDTIIISDEFEKSQNTIHNINKNYGNAVSTGDGTIEIKTRGNTDFFIRRNAN